jgi:hypothetical protein
MPRHPWNALTVSSHSGATHLLFITVAALACQSLGCASANVNQEQPGPDSGTADTTPGADSPGTKNDGPATDVLYGSCDPFTNSGCPSDKKCTALQSGSVLGLGCGGKASKGEGDTCSPVMTGGTQTGDDCGNQLACFKLASDNEATCHRICPTTGTANACPGTDTCSLVVPGLTNLAFCQTSTSCLPLEQTGCPSDQACYYGTKGAVCAPVPGSPKKPGEACVSANDCAKGSTCLLVGSAGVCSSFCSTASGGTPSCSGASTGGTICIALNSGTGTDEPNLGSCRVQP